MLLAVWEGWQVNSPHKGPVMRKALLRRDVFMWVWVTYMHGTDDWQIETHYGLLSLVFFYIKNALVRSRGYHFVARGFPFVNSPVRHLYASLHYSDVIMSVMASQITCVTIVYSSVCSGADQRNHQSPESLAFVRGGGGDELGGDELNVSEETGPRLNIKTVLSTYGDFHVKDKTAVRTSYL